MSLACDNRGVTCASSCATIGAYWPASDQQLRATSDARDSNSTASVRSVLRGRPAAIGRLSAPDVAQQARNGHRPSGAKHPTSGDKRRRTPTDHHTTTARPRRNVPRRAAPDQPMQQRCAATTIVPFVRPAHDERRNIARPRRATRAAGARPRRTTRAAGARPRRATRAAGARPRRVIAAVGGQLRDPKNTGSDTTVGDPDPPPGEAAEEQKIDSRETINTKNTITNYDIHRMFRIRLFSVDCGSLRQSGPRPDPRLLHQAALEALTRSARTNTPRKTRPEQFPAKFVGGGGGVI
ncbi:hypothetical protein F511_24253 [Dorcoceras hygrometricum]|uniref:Uncharacterized protein n=1 Tax=Dorcoceras hygrometricum TaxID=472368 RepID=A0A2Z7AGT5_9LAMI|nr:hypothetical protein F511_24253 [Dorcoceras hygrometricum]